MSVPASRRAGAGLLAHLTATSKQGTHQTRQHAARFYQHRAISSATRLHQQPSSNSNTTPPTQPPAPKTVPRTPTPQTAASQVKPSNTNNGALSPTPDALHSLTDGLTDPPPTLSPDEKQVDWTRSYHGLSSSPFTAEQAAILQAELHLDDIEVKPDGILYLPEIKYRRILNRAFGPGGWGLAPRGETIVTGKLVTREYGLVCGGR